MYFVDIVIINFSNILINFLIFFIIYIILFYFSLKFKLFDVANHRKIHKGNIPLIGGPLIYFSIFFMLFLFDFQFEQIFINIYFISFILILLGSYDDFFYVSPYARIIFQMVCALLVMYSGIQITNINYANQIFELKFFSYFFTLLCLLIIVNAFNFIDGIDGLASSLFIIPMFILLLFSFLLKDVSNFQLIILFNVCLFFLINFKITPLKKIFLGDSGSTFLGLILGCFLIYYSDKQIINSLLVPWLVIIPIFDLTRVVIFRALNKKNPLYPDNIHIHHIFLKYFDSQKLALLIIVFLSVFFSLFGFLLVNLIGYFSLLIYVILFLLFYYFFRQRI